MSTGTIALINPPQGFNESLPSVRLVAEELGVFPNLSLGYAAAVCEAAGYRVKVLDLNAERISLDECVRRLEGISPDLIGYSLVTQSFHSILGFIRAVRARIDVPVVVGGLHLSLYPRETLTHKAIDYGVIGDAEIYLPGLLDRLAGGGDPAKAEGVVYRRNGEVHVNLDEPILHRTSTEPPLFPARHLLDNSLYHSVLTQRKNYTGITTARGCRFRCAFCDRSRNNVILFPPDYVVDEMEQCYRDHGIVEFDIFDAVFPVDRRRTIAICQEIVRRGLPISWSIRSRIDSVDAELLEIMHDAGCRAIYYGIESANLRILRNLNKHVSFDQVREVTRKSRRLGIQTLGFFIVGSPGETRDTVRESVALAKQLDLDYAQFSMLSYFPGSPLYEQLMERTGIDYWREFTLDAAREPDLAPMDTELSPQEIRHLTQRAYLSFYFRSRVVYRLLRDCRSAEQAKRYARVASKMALYQLVNRI